MIVNGNLKTLIDKFVSGEDTSIELANAIEIALDDKFPSDDFLQQTVEMLSMYRPEGGDFLFDALAISQRLVETASYLNVVES